MLGLVCSSRLSSPLLPLLLDVGLTITGELSSFPFAFSFSNFFFGVTFAVGEGIGGALSGLATPSVMDFFEFKSVVVPFLVLRGVLRGEAGCLDTDFLVFGEADDAKTEAEIGVGAGSDPSTAASSS
jgi:hypothetical protein